MPYSTPTHTSQPTSKDMVRRYAKNEIPQVGDLVTMNGWNTGNPFWTFILTSLTVREDGGFEYVMQRPNMTIVNGAPRQNVETLSMSEEEVKRTLFVYTVGPSGKIANRYYGEHNRVNPASKVEMTRNHSGIVSEDVHLWGEVSVYKRHPGDTPREYIGYYVDLHAAEGNKAPVYAVHHRFGKSVVLRTVFDAHDFLLSDRP